MISTLSEIVASTSLVAVIVTLPSAIPRTEPEGETVAIVSSEVDQVTSWLASLGLTVAVKEMVEPISTSVVEEVIVKDSGSTVTTGASSIMSKKVQCQQC